MRSCRGDEIYLWGWALAEIFNAKLATARAAKKQIHVFPEKELHGHSPNYLINVCVCKRFKYSNPRSACLCCCSKKCGPILGICNRSQIHKRGSWEREHYNSVLEITRRTVSSIIAGIHKSEPDIYIRFSPALHLQCSFRNKFIFPEKEYIRGIFVAVRIQTRILQHNGTPWATDKAMKHLGLYCSLQTHNHLLAWKMRKRAKNM